MLIESEMSFKNSNFILVIFSLFFFSCKEENKKIEFEKFQVENKIIPDSVSQKMSEYKLNNTVVSRQSLNIGLRDYQSLDRNYICEALIDKNDTLNIWINNHNEYFGNGILIKIFNKNFKIKSIDPKVIKGIKFENFDPIAQELTLNKLSFKKGDSVFGKLYFECVVDSLKHKKMYGYFRTKIR